MQRLLNITYACAAYLFSLANLSYVLKQVAGGYLDPLIAAALSGAALVLCALLAGIYLVSTRNHLSDIPKTSLVGLSGEDQASIEKASISRRRLQVLMAISPAGLSFFLLVILASFGKSTLLAPAVLNRFDGRSIDFQGATGLSANGSSLHIGRCENPSTLDPKELADFTSTDYGLIFRLRKRASVARCEIVGVRLTVQSVEDAPELLSAVSGTLVEPFVWLVNIPENVQKGTVVDGQLLVVKPTRSFERVAEKSLAVASLPDDQSQPFLVVITCQKQCLIRYRLEVLAEAGWRSAPIEICSDERAAFYKEGPHFVSPGPGGEAIDHKGSSKTESPPPAPPAPTAAPAPSG